MERRSSAEAANKSGVCKEQSMNSPRQLLLMVGLSAIVSLLCLIGSAQTPSQLPSRFAHIVDLTHPLDENTPYIPVPNITFPFKKTPIATVAKNGVAAYRWEIHEHLGTQIDAPNHFFEQALSLERLPVESLVTPLVVIDVSARAESNVDTSVTVADIELWERRHGRIPEHAAVMMASGWDRRINDAKTFVNADASGAMHFRDSPLKQPRSWPVRARCPGLASIRSRSIPVSTLRTPLTRHGLPPASGGSSWLPTCGKSRRWVRPFLWAQRR
jgi:hypothetical protein